MTVPMNSKASSAGDDALENAIDWMRLNTRAVGIGAAVLVAASAGWFWSTRSLNSYADKSDFAGATRRINGGLNGYDDRMARYQKALPVLTEAIQ